MTSGATAGAPAPSLRDSVGALRERNYRLYFGSQVVSNVGTWMQTVAQSFLVLDLTHSGTTLGLATAARYLPIVVLGPAAGLVADRFDKRLLTAVTQATAGSLAAAFAALTGTGTIRMWMVYVLAIALGCVNALDKPTSQSFVSELVDREQLRSAVMLAAMIQNVGRMLGAALGGIIVAVLGETSCFALNAGSYIAVLAALLAMRPGELRRSEPVERQRGQVRAGLRYVASTNELLVPLVMIAVIGTLGWEYPVSLPLLAQESFHGGAGLYGLMTSIMGIGAVAGGVLSVSRRPQRASGLSTSAMAWGVSMLAASAMPTLVTELLVLVAVGYASISFNSMARTALQMASAPAMRGRVMALWSVAWLGSTLFGGPIVGWVGQHAGGRWTLVLGGAPTLLCGVLARPSLRRIDAHAGAQPAAGT